VRSATLFVIGVLLGLITLTPVSGQTATPSNAVVSGRFEVEPGRALYLHCVGSGSPTVVFESGSLSDSSVWFAVSPSIGQITRTCTYDRAGLGQSESPPPGIRTIQDSVDDLHALLAVAEIPGPYVFVGASLGGFIATLYGSQYPDDFAGLVLVDGIPPGLYDALIPLLPEASSNPFRATLTGTDPDDAERIDLLASDDLVAAAPLPPRSPTIVVVSETLENDLPGDWDRLAVAAIDSAWHRYSEAQAKALGGYLVVATGSGHSIWREQPQFVIDAVNAVVNAVRDPSTWATPVS
jgi:pimeloyl-ACP methyl ester carboxylesterase